MKITYPAPMDRSQNGLEVTGAFVIQKIVHPLSGKYVIFKIPRIRSIMTIYTQVKFTTKILT